MSRLAALISNVDLQKIVESPVSEGLVPGLGVVLLDGTYRLEAYAGHSSVARNVPMSALSGFEVSCLMKFYGSLVALHLVDKGQLHLNSPIGHYLPELERASPERASAIKVKHLLSHTSGYRGLDVTDARVKWAIDWTKFVEFFHETPQNFSPGSVFNYEHSEHVILDRILIAVTGMSLVQLVGEIIFAPLSISAKSRASNLCEFIDNYRLIQRGQFKSIGIPPMVSFWDPSIPSFGITLPQIARTGQAILDGELSIIASTEKALKAPIIELPKLSCTAEVERFPLSYGLTCGQFSKGIVGHNASTVGQTCALRMLTSCGVVLAVGINCWAPHVRDSVVKQVLEVMGLTDTGPVGETQNSIFGEFIPADIYGTYIGSYLGAISISEEGKTIKGAKYGSPANTLFSIDLAEREKVVRAPNPTGVCFFPSPDDGGPCFALGAYTYRKYTQS